MPVQKFRDARHMPPVPRATDEALATRIRRAWDRSFALAPPSFPRGVHKFPTLEAAGEARRRAMRLRVRRRSHAPDGR